MCRIAGIANKKLPMDAIEQMVSEMCELQKHGGPDDAGLYSCAESKLVLGHRRLALIDLSAAGHQPMFYEGRYVISFNGEIYNYRELKAELLSLGLHFKTHCDTEVIMAAFAQWNTQSFARLSGMYAFALYDTVERDLYLVRDPAGIKPLYYYSSSISIEFASEIRAFQATGDKKPNEHWPIYQLAYGHIPEPVTTLQDVQPLHKGCFYKYNLSTGVYSLQSFSHYSYSDHISDDAFAKNAIHSTVTDAIRSHLLADAPLGVFLSGGVDSSIVTGVASNFQKEHLKTLSLYFKEAAFSEKNFQDIIINKTGCLNYQHLLTASEFHDALPGIIEAMDMPSCDGINTWFISKYASEHGLKAVLSGVGGDELFGGYPSFLRMPAAAKLQRLPASQLRLAGRHPAKAMKRLPYLSLQGASGLYLFLRGIFTIPQIAKQLGAYQTQVQQILEEHPAVSKLDNLEDKNKASWIELNMYMQNQLLRDADVMSMAHGVEIRVPLLDKSVIKTALSIKPAVKYKGAVPKQILIDSFDKLLPGEIWNRKKMGFGFPFKEWMSSSNYIKDTMLAGNATSARGYEQFMQGNMHWSQLLCLVHLRIRGIE